MKKLLFLIMLAALPTFAQVSPCYKEICVNGYVRDYLGWGGQVVEVAQNGNIIVELYGNPGSRYTFRYETLGYLVNCLGNICYRDQVSNKVGDIGTVAEVYSNDVIIVDFYDEYQQLYHSRELTKSRAYQTYR